MSSTSTGFGDRFGLKLLVAVLLVTAAVFVWTRSYYQHETTQKDTWVDERGKLHVLGITLGESRLREAEIALQSRSEVALYLYPVEHSKAGIKLEAFFPSIADHTKVILLLEASPETIRQMSARASVPQQFENKVARLGLAADDNQAALQMVVSELTLLPSIALTPEILKARFGTADQVTHVSATTTSYRFPALGLLAELSEGGAAQLHFSNPAVAAR